ncbi:MAG: glycosyltransferase family 25 protein [Phycisphaerales bacterium]|nr:glycosyltransferase family 25 protein [Hyphomonadaceae bacterium]
MQPSVVVINLDRDTSRLQHMRRQLRRARLPFLRFSAIDGAALPSALRAYFDPDCRALSAGEIGCYASHLAICREIVAGALQAPTLVLEDDVELPASIAQLLQRLCAALPPDWDIVRLSYPSKRAALGVATLGGGFELVRYSQIPVSTGAYLLSRSGALKFLAPGRRNVPIDHDLRRVWAWNLKTYGVAPPPVSADTLGTSSIDAMAPGVRSDGARSRRIKRQRLMEGAARFQYGMRDFGAWRWIAVEILNIFGRAVPRRTRAILFAWARRALGWRPNRRIARPRHPIFKRLAARSLRLMPSNGGLSAAEGNHATIDDFCAGCERRRGAVCKSGQCARFARLRRSSEPTRLE